VNGPTRSNATGTWSRADRKTFAFLVLLAVVAATALALPLARGAEAPGWLPVVVSMLVAMAIGFPAGKWVVQWKARTPPSTVRTTVLVLLTCTSLPAVVRGVQASVNSWPWPAHLWGLLGAAFLASMAIAYVVSRWLKRRHASG